MTCPINGILKQKIVDGGNVLGRAVHGSVRVGFGLNPDSTRSGRVEQKQTRNQLPTTTGRVGQAQGSERSGRSSPMMSDGE